MPEITWRKVWRFFVTMILSLAALALISDVFYFTIQLFVTERLQGVSIDLPGRTAQQSPQERDALKDLDQLWAKGETFEKRSVVVSLGENTAEVDFSLNIKKDDPLANVLLTGHMNPFARGFVEKAFGQFLVDGAPLKNEDFRSSYLDVNTKQGWIEEHFSATIPIADETQLGLWRNPKTKLPDALFDEFVVDFGKRKKTAVAPYPSDESGSVLRWTNDSSPLYGFIVASQLTGDNAPSSPNILSRQLLLKEVGRALNLPFLNALLNGILEALPILLFLIIVWFHKENLSRHLLFLSQVFLALLVIHFTFRMIGAVGELFSAASNFVSQHLADLKPNRYLPPETLQVFAISSSMLSTSLGYTSVGTALMGVIIPALLLRRSHEWDETAEITPSEMDPLNPRDRSGGKRRVSIFAVFTYLIILLMIIIPAYFFIVSRPVLTPFELRLLETCFSVGLCGLLLILLSRSLYRKLDGRPIPPIVGASVFWVIFIGNLIWSFTVGAELISQSDVSIQSGWVWWVYATCVGAALVYALVRILYSLARHAGFVPLLNRRTHSALILFAILTAIPMNALYASSTPAASYYEVWNLAAQLDGLIKFIFLAGLTWFFYEEGRRRTTLRKVTLEVGLVAMATVFYPSTANWLFLPLTFLIGYRLLSRYIQPADFGKELEPLYAPVFGNRLAFLEQIVRLNTGERGYENLHKTLMTKLGTGEITYAEFVQQMDARRKELDESNKSAQCNGKPIKDVALTFGPKETAWENGKHGAYWALLFSLPWMAIWLFNFMAGEAARSSYPLWAFFSDLLNLLTSWVGIGFLFGYFYPFLGGKNGLEKGLRLWLVIVLPALPLALINNSTATGWQGFLFWVLQVFIHCMLLGLVAFDYMTLRQGYRDWQMLFELHGIPSVGVSVSTILIAAGTAITTLLQSQTQEIIKTALTFMLPNADKLINILPK